MFNHRYGQILCPSPLVKIKIGGNLTIDPWFPDSMLLQKLMGSTVRHRTPHQRMYSIWLLTAAMLAAMYSYRAELGALPLYRKTGGSELQRKKKHAEFHFLKQAFFVRQANNIK